MTEAEYVDWQQSLAIDYAREQVAAGRWEAADAVPRALEENRRLLPQGLATPRMLVLRAIDDDGTPVGRAWVGFDHPRGAPDCAFLWDIEIDPAHRGSGHGRALLAAVEAAVRDAGVSALELNVFGGNQAAIALYASSDYSVTTLQMRKVL